MQVSDCMTRDVKMAQPSQTLREAAQTMADCDAGILPVGDGRRLVGMITDRDIAIRGIAQGLGPDTPVDQVMSREVLYCYEDDAVEDVLRNMGEVQVRRMPVVDRDKHLVGIVSLSDLACEGELEEVGDTLNDITRAGGLHTQTAH